MNIYILYSHFYICINKINTKCAYIFILKYVYIEIYIINGSAHISESLHSGSYHWRSH